MSKLTDQVWELAQPVVSRHGCEIWDVEYVKEAGQRYLRLYIDKQEGITIGDCEAVSREFDAILDERDLIAESYIFEVSSPGADRKLRGPEDYERYLGSAVDVKLYSPLSGKKVYSGALSAYDTESFTIAEPGGETRLQNTQVASIRLRIDV